MIKFHTLNKDDINSISYSLIDNLSDWSSLKDIFTNYEFKSLVGKEKSWNNFINTFNNLERNKKYVN